MKKRDFLSLADCTPDELQAMLALAAELKAELARGTPHPYLAGKTLAMIFEKPSLRTRVTFDVGMTQLGGHSVNLAPADIQLGTRETVPDIARNLERWVDFIMARVFRHETLLALARHARVPVINALSDRFHPCQVVADLLTLQEHFGRLAGLRVAFVGDGNNMVHSWLAAAVHLDFGFALACPPGYEPDEDLVRAARDAGAAIEVHHAVAEAVREADAVYTDVWTSMGDEDEAPARRRDFEAYQVNDTVLAAAKHTAVVMHCLPAHRGEEITAEVLDGPRSIVFDQAENRLHAQKAILVWLDRQRERTP